jgi:hypothetical protein
MNLNYILSSLNGNFYPKFNFKNDRFLSLVRPSTNYTAPSLSILVL